MKQLNGIFLYLVILFMMVSSAFILGLILAGIYKYPDIVTFTEQSLYESGLLGLIHVGWFYGVYTVLIIPWKFYRAYMNEY